MNPNRSRTAKIFQKARRINLNKYKRDYGNDWEVFADFMYHMDNECYKIVRQGEVLKHLAGNAIARFLNRHETSDTKELRRAILRKHAETSRERQRKNQQMASTQRALKLMKQGEILKLSAETALLDFLESLEQPTVGPLMLLHTTLAGMRNPGKTNRRERDLINQSTKLLQSVAELVEKKHGSTAKPESGIDTHVH